MQTAQENSTNLAAPEAVLRLAGYLRRHGLAATFGRALTELRHSLFENRMILYYCDLPEYGRNAARCLPKHLTAERKERQEALDPVTRNKMLSFWNPELCWRDFVERFRAGASLWLIRVDGELAGYGWTMAGHTIVPHYCPLGPADVHFFDFLVFPEFRGRQINPALVNYMLRELAAEGKARAYIEVAQWNRPQLNSLGRTGFRFFGVARKVSLFGRTLVEWTTPPNELFPKHVDTSAIAKATSQTSLQSRQI